MIQYPRGYSKKTINAFTFLIYPDSCKDDWLSILEDLQIQAYVSPLHDQDKTKDGTPKKPHYHILIVFSGGKSETFCQGIIDDLGGANSVGVVVRSIEASVRYLVHAGSIDKYRYNADDIICFGGAPLKKYFVDVDLEDTSTVTQVISYIKENKRLAFHEFFDYALAYKPSWVRACRSSWFLSIVKEYLKSYNSRFDSFVVDHMS